MSNTSDSVTCPSCGTTSAGKFCGECGSALLGAPCAACSTLLTPGARFCHRCSAAVGAPARAATPPTARPQPPPSRTLLPWVIGTAAVFALVIIVAVQQSSATNTTVAGPDIPLDGPMSATSAPFAGGSANGVVRAPDISAMSPRERADRLYDRVMRLAAAGKSDSATFFATMATQAYEILDPADNDLRYDYGRMAELSGNLPVAKKQADAILASNPDHLLGLILAVRVAQLQGDTKSVARLSKTLLAVQATELSKNIEEYERHKGDIDAALVVARRK
ncbi:MAG: zinc ribbon domain-containing protein [Gemmatimonadaceae bacterium]